MLALPKIFQKKVALRTLYYKLAYCARLFLRKLYADGIFPRWSRVFFVKSESLRSELPSMMLFSKDFMARMKIILIVLKIAQEFSTPA